MNTIDVFGVLPGTVFLGKKKNELPAYPKKGPGPTENGIWLMTTDRGVKYVIARQGTVNEAGGWSGCEKSIGYNEWVSGGKLNPCTGEPVDGAVAPAPAPAAAPAPKATVAPASSGVHPAVIAGGVGAAGFVALVATGVIKL